MKSMGGKQPKGGYMYFYMTECKRMKEDGTHSDVRSKWNSMSDAQKESYTTQSRNDSKEYKERRKAHEKKDVSTRCSIKMVYSLIEHLKKNDTLNVLSEMGFRLLIRVKDRPIRRELCRSLMEQFDVKQCIAKYGDYSFPLGVSTAAAVLGVQNKGNSVVEVCRSKNWKELASKYGLNHKVTYAEVEEDIKSGSYRGDELKARVLLYLVGIFLCPTGDTSTNKDNMKLICDEGLKGEFNWAEYVHSRLIESIITFQKGSQRYLKGCIAILEVALFDYWSGCDSLPAYERHGVARIRAWEKEEVVRVMAKLKVDRSRKLEMDVEEAEEEMVGGVDYGQGDYGQGKQSKFDILLSELAYIKKIVFDIHKRQSRVEETHERHKMEVEGKIDILVKKVEVLSGEVNLLTGVKIDRVVKEFVEIRSEFLGLKEVVHKNFDEGLKLKGEIKEMKSYVEKKYDELRKFEEEKMEEMRRKDVTNIYTPESVIDANLDSECPTPQKNKQKVVKADIPIGIEPVEAAICDYLWNSGLESGYTVILMGNQYAQVSDVATLKPMEWVGGMVIDLLAWTVCYDSKKSGRMIGYIPYHLEIMITINYNNSHWYLLVLDMMKILDSYNEKHIWVEACGSLGKVPLQRFKFVEHKITEQLNGYDCGIYVMMWMELIDSSGATGDFVVGEWDHMRILNDLVFHNKNQLREKMTKAAMLQKNNKRKR
ncbi:hypothetical protein F3Y22_tig00111221pilonHSYRG00017 [Hibiscus syriacus]|uniref:Ubiquitin-like protease family profile domain-containing protein n=1 Tax=Hibiscus syriacus TaxID=106335 RepID=A0A6A2YUF3_HIBSY|nr:hypothetical protein F3Y22_tig00111221pilonHSYRG00017 [Hibiscus syriacus]